MKTYWLLGTKEDGPVSNIIDKRTNLPIECLFSKSRENSPVCISASQRLLSKMDSGDLSGDEIDEMTSPSSYTARSVYSEIEQYIIDNNLSIYSDESGTATDIGSSMDAYVMSQELSSNQSSCQAALDISRDSEKCTNQKDGSELTEKNQPMTSRHECQQTEKHMTLGQVRCQLL